MKNFELYEEVNNLQEKYKIMYYTELVYKAITSCINNFQDKFNLNVHFVPKCVTFYFSSEYDDEGGTFHYLNSVIILNDEGENFYDVLEQTRNEHVDSGFYWERYEIMEYFYFISVEFDNCTLHFNLSLNNDYDAELQKILKKRL